MNAPVLSRLQAAWLQELGLDKRMLSAWVRDEAALAPPTPPASDGMSERTRPIVPAPPPAGDPVPAGRVAKAQPSSAADAPLVPAAIPEDWEGLRQHVSVCVACELHTGRSQAVFGHGATTAPEWMLIGEAPGDQDDRAGLPFQGKAGVLLRAMLASVGVSADESAPVFYANIVKCRPLGNRPPAAAEIAACRPYLLRQIALLKPVRILTLGRLAAQSVLGQDGDLETLRGQVHHLPGADGKQIPVVATYHPAALLLRPQHKADAWRDLVLARSLPGGQ